MSMHINPKHFSTFTDGTSLQGYVRITYQQLVERLGKSIKFKDFDKVPEEWVVIDRGVTATIYVYKVTKAPKEEYWWHVGGHSTRALDVVRELFPNNEIRTGF